MATRAVTLARPVAARSSLRRDEILWAYVFLLPWLVGLCVFIAGPILFSLGLSFFNYTLGREATFIGLDNWIKAFTQDEQFWPSISRTFLYTAFVVPLSVFGALLTAILLNQRLRATTFYRTLFFMPHLAPVVAATYIWLWLLNPQYGLLNEIIWQVGLHLTGSGIKGPGWFGDPSFALPA